MNGLRYTLILNEPILANHLAGDTNSARSLPYVPGGLVRGALIGAYLHGEEIDAENEDFRRLFLSGKTRFLPAYPEYKGMRSIPGPLAWKVKKYSSENGDLIYNFGARVSDEVDLRTAGFDLWCLEDHTVHSLDPAWNINVHTQRDALYGRAMGLLPGEEGARGAVFRYEALPAGSHLQGLVFTQDEQDTETIIQLLDGRSIMLGKGRTAGYGHAKVEKIQKLPANWREDYWPWKVPSGGVTSFTLTFLSSALVRDNNGHFTIDPIPALFTRGLLVHAKKVFCRTEIVGGFNRTWGLPLPQTWAIAAGSVFVLESAEPVSFETLQKLEETGLGERTAEGFGCLVVGTEQTESIGWKREVLSYTPTASSQSLSTTDKAVGNILLKRLLQRELDEKVLAYVSAATSEYSGGLPGSQLSRWRVIVRSVLGTNDPSQMKRLTDLYAKESLRNSTAWKKMERARLRSKGATPRLTEWMESILTDQSQPWAILGYESAPVRKAGAMTFEADEKLRVEYRLRLLDAVFAALAHKKLPAQSKREVQNG